MQTDSCCRCSNTAAQFQVLVNKHCVSHQLKKKGQTFLFTPLCHWPAHGTEPRARSAILTCASLPPAPTVQAAVVVLPVRAHGVLFAYKHHFGHAHLRETSPLQGPAHAEQLLQPKRTTDKHTGKRTHRMNHGSVAAQSPLQRQRGASWDRPDALTTMSSSVTRGCRLFTVIFVPSRGLTTGWGDTRNCVITPTDSNQLKYEETQSILVVYGTWLPL